MFEQVRELIAAQLGIDAENVTMESAIEEELGADSLDVVEMLVKAEDDFGIFIPDDDVIAIRTVGDVVMYLENAKELKI